LTTLNTPRSTTKKIPYSVLFGKEQRTSVEVALENVNKKLEDE